MKINTITKTAAISHKQLLDLFVDAVYGDAKKATGKDRTFYRALGRLVGISDADAVEAANRGVKAQNRITVTEFRKKLPTVFSTFAQAMLEAAE